MYFRAVVDVSSMDGSGRRYREYATARRSHVRTACETSQHIVANMRTKSTDLVLQVLIDFSKAFDRVPHSKLIQVMRQYKFHKNVIDWTKSLLQSRSQKTVVDSEYSRSTKATSGVPQGSVIGPLWFDIYINCLLRSIESIPEVYVFAFADDIKVASGDQVQLQRALDCVATWCKDFGLKINKSKSEHMVFRPRTDCRFQIDGEIIKKVNYTKDLGVVITDTLK